MIKYLILVVSALSATAYAGSATGSLTEIPDTKGKVSKGFYGQVGLGAISLPEYIGGDDTEVKVIPLINVSYNDTLYFKYNRLGAWLYKSDSGLRFGALVAQHRGFDDSDLPDEFSGYGDRDDSILAGLNVGYNFGRFWSEFSALTDVSDNSDGTKLQAQLGYTFLATRNYTLSANAKVESLDKDFVDYYYSNNESTVNYSLSIIGTYKLSPKWTLMGALSITALGDEISDSVIVEDDSPSMALIGATYSF